ncbi:hypothetical protein Ciccas_009341 [Cichlidogyrus casuarinus]|uniref:SCP2 domain-containing protein n=1 Tax=Cichlidogyrus casuarinus TaxID=1844966 RepID=A0ABD2PYA2_9PLAT
MLDFFLDDWQEAIPTETHHEKKMPKSPVDLLQSFQSSITPELVKQAQTVFAFKFTDMPKPAYWVIDLKNLPGSIKPAESVDLQNHVEGLFICKTKTILDVLQRKKRLFETFLDNEITLEGHHAVMFILNSLLTSFSRKH